MSIVDDAVARACLTDGMIDSHFHALAMAGKGLDPRSILTWCFAHGMARAVDVSVSLDDFNQRLSLASSFPRLSLTAGVYPSEALMFARSPVAASRMLRGLEAQLAHDRVVAVGEIGLDAQRDYAPVHVQDRLFREQLQLAAQAGLPVVVHNRGCDRLVLDALREARLEHTGVMHCFSSNYDTARKFVEIGYRISFAGNLTYRSSRELQDAARKLPSEAILVETDAPYLAPQAVRGRANHCGYIGYTYQFLAQLRNEALADLVADVRRNFSETFPQDAASGSRSLR